MNTRLYLRASTKEQDANRAMQLLTELCKAHKLAIADKYIKNLSGTKLNKPQLNKLFE
jgi:DNA invertase Pin-like site-specific DNA recombinase